MTWICNKQLTSNVRYKFCKIYEYSKCLVDTLEKICRMLNNVENVWPVFLLSKLYLLRKNSLTVSFKQENVSESIFCFNDPMVTFTLYWYLKKIIKMKQSKWSEYKTSAVQFIWKMRSLHMFSCVSFIISLFITFCSQKLLLKIRHKKWYQEFGILQYVFYKISLALHQKGSKLFPPMSASVSFFFGFLFTRRGN